MKHLSIYLLLAFMSVSAIFMFTATAQEVPSCHSGMAKQAYLGVFLAESESTDSKGVLVEDISSDSPASKAGLQAGDVITQFNGVPANSPIELRNLITQNKPGDEATVTYLRNGQTLQAKVVLWGKAPMQEEQKTWVHKMQPEANQNPDKGFMGVVLNVNKTEMVKDGGTNSSATVTIQEVIKDSGAEKAGLQAGDVVLLINGVAINGDADLLYQTLENSKAGDVVRITYLRNGQKGNASVTLGKQPENMPAHIMKMEKEACMGNGSKTCAGGSKSAGCCAGEKTAKKAFLGVVGETVTAELAKEKGIKNMEGVYISEVVKGSAAEEAGLQAGDVLTYINKEDIETMEELSKVVGSYIPGDKVKLKYLRNGKTKKAEATLTTNNKAGGCCAVGEKKSCDGKKQTPGANDSKNVEKIIIIEGNDADLPEKFDVVIDRAENGEGFKVKVVKVFISDPNSEEVKMLENTFQQEASGNNAKTITTQPDALKLTDLSFYPNPNQGKFTLNFAVAETAPTLLRITDLSGKEIYTEDLGNFSGAYSKQIDISENAEGIYLLQIVQGDKVLVKKLLLQQ
ncbi:PDZ domain-containing protein [Sphingobacteriales bacterium UPWRP_1]|nr:hypothetical protein B6N25_09735 [Sphingobacteriales bacterium TSM_CSS]PSJ74948.1 PDZ domain-containing protein [Sphingobacteriales bacterium UPWRP_1]